jgi:threonine synthase
MIEASQVRGLSRFAADLPAISDFVELGAGDTPLLSLNVLAGRLGLRRLSAKMESQNPTGSYKDRVAAMSLSLARQRHNRGWIATSSGNAGLAMAAYGARAGLPGFLCLVATAPMEKRLPLMPYSIGVVAVDGVGRHSKAATDGEMLQQVCDAAKHHDLYLGITAHAFNPEGMRGIDTIAYELIEQAPNATHVYVPTGGGGLAAAIGRGLEHRASPAKVIICQPAGCAPVAKFLSGLTAVPEVAQCESDISGLQIPCPPDGVIAAEAASRSGGWGTAIDDDAILAAQRILAELEGIFVEPASATALAALIDDLDHGRLSNRDHPVLILTGAGWKDLSRFTTQASALPLVPVDEVSQHITNWVGNHALSTADFGRSA